MTNRKNQKSVSPISPKGRLKIYKKTTSQEITLLTPILSLDRLNGASTGDSEDEQL